MDLSRLRLLLGSDASVARFVALFREEAPRLLDALRDAAADKNWEAASTAVHTLKGQLRYFGADALADQAAELETGADRGGVSDERLASFDLGVRVFLTELDSHFSSENL